MRDEASRCLRDEFGVLHRCYVAFETILSKAVPVRHSSFQRNAYDFGSIGQTSTTNGHNDVCVGFFRLSGQKNETLGINRFSMTQKLKNCQVLPRSHAHMCLQNKLRAKRHVNTVVYVVHPPDYHQKQNALL